MNYDNWLKEWLLNWAKPLVKPRTYERYVAIVRTQVAPRLGKFNISELTANVLQQFAAELSASYSPNTVAGIIAVVKSSLVCAKESGKVSKQFSACIKNPKAGEKEVTCFTLKEQRKIENYVKKSGKPKLFGIVMCLYTGLRIGELLALEWGDIDLKRHFVSVNKSCRDQWENGRYIKAIDTPKTRNSVRKIPLPKSLLPYLKVMKESAGSGYVFTSYKGDLPIRSYQRTFENLLEKLGIPHRGFHTLRHTFATRALECGMDVKTLSVILGHTNPAITLKRYAHSLTEHQSAMMNKLGKMFN
ncbi:MAG: site-specific integrase [Clostridia bacterium]|nr:site-specific integrase [Clostridia bacterium]